MADIDALAQEYARRIKYSNDPNSEAQRIIREIKQHAYIKAGFPLSPQDKKKLGDEIYKQLTWDPISKKSVDNQGYLDLVNYILSQT